VVTGAPPDPRLTPANGRVAHVSLRGRVAADRYVAGAPARIAVPLADLCREPGGVRDRQLLMGAGFLVLERWGEHAFGQAAQDGYVGWVTATALVDDAPPTHSVAVPASHLYPRPDIREREVAGLSFGARLTITGEQGQFARTDRGLFIPWPHLRALRDRFSDPVQVARLFIGTPYLWGGNGRGGIDCSGLVQAAFVACGVSCPPDSDLQAVWGDELAPDAPLRKGDLLFWRGHVAMVAGGGHIIHANAHHMAVVEEPMDVAVARIEATGGGRITARRRPILPV
jgi:cell wall-associated NlpC family hydrolase